jgi:putative transposase
MAETDAIDPTITSTSDRCAESFSADDANPGHATLRGGHDENLPSTTDGPKGWHSRWYMPHFDAEEVTQHVTFHLADSLPKQVLRRLAEDLELVAPELREVERRRGVESLMDAGYGSCDLQRPEIAKMVQDTLLHFDGDRYRLLAWAVMPNHVHTLFRTLPGWSMARVVASWKSWTGKHIFEWRQKNGPQDNGLQHGSQESQRVWHREYWDRYIRDEKHFAAALSYIHQNPVKAGLVTRPEDWPWSSAFPGNATLRGGKSQY